MDKLDQSLATNTSLHFLSVETFAILSKFTALQLEGSYTANTHWSFRLSSSHLVLILGCVLEKNLKHFSSEHYHLFIITDPSGNWPIKSTIFHIMDVSASIHLRCL